MSISTRRRQARGLGRSTPDRVELGLVAGLVVSVCLFPVRLGRAFGLPAHPLLLHLPIVLVPLLSAAAAALALRMRWRTRYGAPVAMLAVVTLAATILTVGAGRAFLHQRAQGRGLASGSLPGGLAQRSDARFQALRYHAHLGQSMELIAIAFTVCVVAMVIVDRMRQRRMRADVRLGQFLGGIAPRALSVAVILLAAISTVWMIRTGHAGARVTWGYPASARSPSTP